MWTLLDIIKHGRQGYQKMTDTKIKWTTRVRQVAVDVFIIVFAITLSMAFDRWRLNGLNEDAEREFLVGIKMDILSDLKEMQNDSVACIKDQKGLAYLTKVSFNKASDADSIAFYYPTVLGGAVLVVNNANFESLKGSGNSGIIQNKQLLHDIFDFYQVKLPSLVNEAKSFARFKGELIGTYLDQHLLLDDAGQPINLQQVLRESVMKNYMRKTIFIEETIRRYQLSIQAARSIVATIDLELKNK